MQPNITMILSEHQRATIEARLNAYIRLAADADKRGLHARCERFNDHHDALFIAAAHVNEGTANAADLKLVTDALDLSL